MESSRDDSQPTADRQRFPAKMRLKGHEFKPVFDAKCSAADGILIVYGRANHCRLVRLGLTVSRRVGQAHERNRWKRLIREAFRCRSHELPRGLDFLVLPRAKSMPRLAEVERSLMSLARRIAKKQT